MNQSHANRLNGIDAMKFLMAFPVVFIHIQPLFYCLYPNTVSWFIRLAVPYFFIASGFLTARGYQNIASDADRRTYLKRRALRFGKMFVIWLLIYLPLSLISFSYANGYVLAEDVAIYIIQVVLFGESHWAWPLWYLYSSMIAYFMIYKLSRFRSGKSMTVILVALIVVCQLILPYLNSIFPKYVAYVTKGVFERILAVFPIYL